LTEIFKETDDVLFVGIQTVFEGHGINTKDKLRKNQLKYDLKIPMAHAAGNPQTRTIPEIMRKYRSGGTPWTIIIDPKGRVVYNQFHIEPDHAAELINVILSKY
jgi:hypothetical protein